MANLSENIREDQGDRSFVKLRDTVDFQIDKIYETWILDCIIDVQYNETASSVSMPVLHD